MQTIQENINVQAIYDLFEEYRNAYGREWERLEKCERMYRGDHWHDGGRPRGATARHPHNPVNHRKHQGRPCGPVPSGHNHRGQPGVRRDS